MTSDISDEWVAMLAARAIASEYVAEHNAAYDVGTERERFKATPLWVERKSLRLATAALTAVADEIRAQALRDAADAIAELAPGTAKWLRARADGIAQ